MTMAKKKKSEEVESTYVSKDKTASIAEGLRPQSPQNTGETIEYTPEQTRNIAESLRPQSPQETGETIPFKNPYKVNNMPEIEPIKMQGWGKEKEDARQYGQKKIGRFIPPNPEPTTYKEIMENWEAKDEYDKQIAKKQNRMRLIGQAIAGAGEIAARLATGASGQNVMGDIMLKDNAQALDNLKTLRAQNKERFGTQLTMMQQENALKRQAALDKQTQANKDREFNLAWSKANRDFDIKIAQLKESGRLNDAKIAESEKKQAYYDLMQKYYPEKVKSEIAKNNSQTTANYKRAAKDEDEIKTVQQIDVKGKTYKLPKNSRVINARSAVVDALKNKLNDLDANARAKAEAYINQEVNQFENNSPEAIIDGLNKIAQDFPELVDNALTRISKKEEGSNSHDDPYGQH